MLCTTRKRSVRAYFVDAYGGRPENVSDHTGSDEGGTSRKPRPCRARKSSRRDRGITDDRSPQRSVLAAVQRAREAISLHRRAQSDVLLKCRSLLGTYRQAVKQLGRALVTERAVE